MTPLVHGALFRVRMWTRWRFEATQAAKPADLKQDPLSVTNRNVPISPVSESVRSYTHEIPSKVSTSANAASKNAIASPVFLVMVTSHARLTLPQ